MSAPEWRVLAEALVPLAVDDLVTYDWLDEQLGRDFRTNRSPIYRAQTEMLATQHRTLANVVGVGYRIAKANEHHGLASKQRKKARRSITRAVRIINGTNVSALTSEERLRLDRLEHTVKAQANMLRRTEVRVSRVEKDGARQRDRVDLLVAQLRSKGIDVDLPGVDD